MKKISPLIKRTYPAVLPYIAAFLISFAVGVILFAVKGIAPFGNDSLLCMDLWGQYFPMYVQHAQVDSLSDLMFSWNGSLGYNNWAETAYYCNSPLLLFLRFFTVDNMVNALDWLCLIKISLCSTTMLAFLRKKLHASSPVLVSGAVAYSLSAYMLAFVSQCMWTDLMWIAPLVLIGLERLIYEKKWLMYTLTLGLALIVNFYIGFALCIFLVLYYIRAALALLHIEKDKWGRRHLLGWRPLFASLGRFSLCSVLGGALSTAVLLPTLMAIMQTRTTTQKAAIEFRWYQLPASEGAVLPGGMTLLFIVFFVCLTLYVLWAGGILRPKNRETASLKITGAADLFKHIGRFAAFYVITYTVIVLAIVPLVLVFTDSEKLKMIFDGTAYEYLSIYFKSFLPVRELQLGYPDGTANVSVGVLVFLLVPLYFLNQKIRLQEKITSALITGFLFLSINLDALNWLWHDLAFPNQLPMRWSFLFSLFIVLLGCSGIIRAKDMSIPRMAAAVVIGLGCLGVTTAYLNGSDPALPTTYWVLSGITAIVLLACVIAPRLPLTAGAVRGLFLSGEQQDIEARKTPKRYLSATRVTALCLLLVAAVQVYDCGSSFITVSQYEGSKGLQTAQERWYSEKADKLNAYGTMWQMGDNDFYRIETAPGTGLTFEPGTLGGYAGIAGYSSTMNTKAYTVLRYFGNRVYAEGASCVYNIGSPVQNSLFGVKYVIDFNRSLQDSLPGTIEQAVYTDGAVYENPTALPVAFGVSDDAATWTIPTPERRSDDNPTATEEVCGITSQNEVVNKFCGRQVDPFELIVPANEAIENAVINEGDTWDDTYFNRIDGMQPAVFRYSFVCQRAGAYYAEHNFRRNETEIEVASGDHSFKLDVFGERFKYLGSYQAGDVITITVTHDGNYNTNCGLRCFYFNEDSWQSACSQLKAQGMTVEYNGGTTLRGQITMKADGLMFTSIIDDGGWEVLCDGQSMPLESIADTFVAARIPAGTHTIELKYHVPYLGVSFAVSVLALLVILWLALWKKILPRKAAAFEEKAAAKAAWREEKRQANWKARSEKRAAGIKWLMTPAPSLDEPLDPVEEIEDGDTGAMPSPEGSATPVEPKEDEQTNEGPLKTPPIDGDE
ncbi:MAG: YfhO family protein [Clostridia bacterium]|nr:YfhO family protein [Clostridia bacterium]